MTDAITARDGTTGQISLGPRTRKLTPGEAGFREGGGIPALQCSDCRYFVQGECFVVDVKPAPDDYCDEFNPMVGAGRVPSVSGGQLNYLSQNQDLFITRVSTDRHTGRKRWFATSSGVKRDAFDERMSTGLFDDFIRRINAKEPAPAVFASEAWHGGNPYLGVAHYLDLDGYGILGDCERVYRDVAVLKAQGYFRDTPLALAAYKSIKEDIDRNRPPVERVRISIAFVDWGHEHEGNGMFERKNLTDRCEMCERGVGEKVYRKGQLVHLALTRIPAYIETAIELEERSMSNKRDDAASIVGGDNAEELERKAKLTLRSEAEGAGAIVIKAEDEYPDASGTTPMRSYFGGAQNLAEAEAFIGKSSAPVLLDSWRILAGVLTNIATSPTADKPAAVRQALGDFQQSLDVLTAKALRQVVPLIAATGGQSMDKPTVGAEVPPTPAPEPEPAPPVEPVVARAEVAAPAAQVAAPPPPAEGQPQAPSGHPLDEALVAFKTAYDEAVANYQDTGERLGVLQVALDGLADAVMRAIGAAAPAPSSAPANGQPFSEEQMAVMASLFSQQMAQVIAPVMAAIERVNRAQTPPREAPRAPAPPVRRALVPQAGIVPEGRQMRLVPRALAPQGMPGVIGHTPKPAGGLKQLIRRSVGIQE